MKKIMIVSALLLSAVLITPTAYAWYGGGMGGQGDCPVYSDNAKDRQAFYDNTEDLRANLAADQAERAAVMAGENPDPERVRALTEKIVKQQTQLRKQAGKYNVTLMGPGSGMGHGGGNCNFGGQGRNGGGHHGRGGHMMNW